MQEITVAIKFASLFEYVIDPESSRFVTHPVARRVGSGSDLSALRLKSCKLSFSEETGFWPSHLMRRVSVRHSGLPQLDRPCLSSGSTTRTLRRPPLQNRRLK